MGMSVIGTYRTIAAAQDIVRYWSNNGHCVRCSRFYYRPRQALQNTAAESSLSDGAPGEIRTPDPQIRSLRPLVEITQYFCKPKSIQRIEVNGLQDICKPVTSTLCRIWWHLATSQGAPNNRRFNPRLAVRGWRL